ncbi:uncharacterized protein LOC108199280 [Daucus carota subsp. sativus]|uniref:uncharacterized protein LOC108199280 n=1 Tax=Daucus carota subsp. sativus TaxID=79200 RepID=UPI0007F002D8|nr:PREDICTED: DNA-3-methyladenine glycosylase-like [Daucus carota subsp. sativus]
MSKEDVRRPARKESSCLKEKDDQKPNYNLLSKHLKKVYPDKVYNASTSPLSLSSLSLSLSQNSSDSTDSSPTLNQKIAAAVRLIAPREKRELPTVARYMQNLSPGHNTGDCEGLNRCNWITANSDRVYVQFHDERWGLPEYDDNKLFELLAMSGMLMDFNWTEILRRKELFREAFAGFDPQTVARMGEKEIMEISTNKAIMLAESRVRCIIDNAKCIQRIDTEYGSFGGYLWGYMDYKPVINRFRYARNVPLRSPKAEAISKDLVKRGFRFVGPVIVYSFMQAAGMSIDHLVDCFRFQDCVSHAERPWRHV